MKNMNLLVYEKTAGVSGCGKGRRNVYHSSEATFYLLLVYLYVFYSFLFQSIRWPHFFHPPTYPFPFSLLLLFFSFLIS